MNKKEILKEIEFFNNQIIEDIEHLEKNILFYDNWEIIDKNDLNYLNFPKNLTCYNEVIEYIKENEQIKKDNYYFIEKIENYENIQEINDLYNQWIDY